MVNRTTTTIKTYIEGKELRSFNKRIFMQEKEHGESYVYIITVWKKIEGDPIKIKKSGWQDLRRDFYIRTYYISEETLIEMFFLLNEFKDNQLNRSVQTKPAN